MASKPSSRPIHRISTRQMPAVTLDGTDTNVNSGTCPVCKGKVMEKVEITEGARRHTMTSGGLHCTKCGIKFEFSPPNDVLDSK